MYKRLFNAAVMGVGVTLLFATCTKNTDKPIDFKTAIDMKGTDLAADQVSSEMWFSLDGGKTYAPGVLPNKVGQTFKVKVFDSKLGDAGDYLTSTTYTPDWSASNPAPSDPTSDNPEFTYTGSNLLKVTFINKFCKYDASYWAGSWSGVEDPGSTDANNITQDATDPNKFTMDNYWGDGVDVYFNLTPSTSYFDQIVTIPAQVTSEGGTASGTGTYSQCAGTFHIDAEYSFPGTDDAIVALGRGSASGSRCYVATAKSFFFTANGGSSWSDQKPSGLNPADIRAITTPHVTANQNVFASTAAGVFHSSNRGATWTAVNNGFGDKTDVTSLIMVGTTLYATTNGGGFFTSTDNAATWVASNTGITNKALVSLFVSGSDIYVGADGGDTYHSADGGATWVAFGTDVKNTFTTILANDTTVFAATEVGLFQSDDSGVTWTASKMSVVSMATQTTSDGTVYVFAATSDGKVFANVNADYKKGWSGWSDVSGDFGTVTGLSIESATSTSSSTKADAFRLFFATSDGGAYVSTDQGGTWSKVTGGSDYVFAYDFTKQ